ASCCETLDLELTERLAPQEIQDRLNRVLSPGLEISQVELLADQEGWPQPDLQHFTVASPEPVFDQGKITSFLQSSEFFALRKKPKETKRIDIRPLVAAIRFHDACHVELVIRRRERDNIKITDLVAALFRLPEATARQLAIVKQRLSVADLQV
ncbi:MAG: DUF2344 domain-containing protein, partial [Desulfobacca sp.]|uniref:DUF2344 domain-containing protein n=1 Tax=Desulfobacca sp. TaxID=2067990 RepID=UPI00404BA26E